MKINKKIAGQLSLKLIAVVAIFIGCFIIFALIADEAVYEKNDTFDKSILTFFNFHSDSLISVMQVVTFFGSSEFLLPTYILLVIYFFIKKKYHYSIAIIIVSLGGTGLMYALKDFFHRQRPDLPLIKGITSYSFPSGHSFSSILFCSILIYLLRLTNLPDLWKWVLTIMLILFSVTIGISRIILQVHYPTDVIGGLCLGITWIILSYWLLKKFFAFQRSYY